MLNDVQSAVETVFTARFRPSPTIPFAVRTSSIHMQTLQLDGGQKHCCYP